MMISRGYNRSGQPAGIGNYALEHLVEDVRALVQVLLKKNSYHPALKIGKISKQAMAMVSVQKFFLAHGWAPVIGEHHHNYQ